jgi:hypothetical protein
MIRFRLYEEETRESFLKEGITRRETYTDLMRKCRSKECNLEIDKKKGIIYEISWRYLIINIYRSMAI